MKKTLFLLCLSLSITINAQVRVIAHRGYWDTKGSAQNSITSIIKADEIGAYGSEFDVWRTKEGKLIVNHDRRHNGLDIYSDEYKDVIKIKLDNGERIPNFKSFLKETKKHTQIRLICELKSLPSKEEEKLAVKEIINAVKKYELLDRTDFIAFSLNACLAFRQELPTGNVYYLNGDLSPKEIYDLKLTGIDYSVHTLKKHPEWIDEAHHLGLKVNVWTVNKENDMRYFIKKGVDFITTDKPVVLQRLLQECK